MHATRVTADLHVADVEAAKGFYTDFLGLSTEEFNMGWVARYTSPRSGANVQLVTHDAMASEVPVISVHTQDVDGAYEEALGLGYEIVHPLTTEAWGGPPVFRASTRRERHQHCEPPGLTAAHDSPLPHRLASVRTFAGLSGASRRSAPAAVSTGAGASRADRRRPVDP